MTEAQAHVHSLGSTGECACGWKMVIPPIYCSIEVGIKSQMLVNDGFNCDSLDVVIEQLERAIRKLRQCQASGVAP